MPKRNRHKTPCFCAFCGKAFLGLPRTGRVNRFCTKTCSAKSRVGALNPHWKGGVKLRGNDGRAFVKPDGPRTPYVLRYRVVMERKLGRPLRDDEIVHHIDGDARNDDPSNLELMTQSDHARLHRSTGGRFQ